MYKCILATIIEYKIEWMKITGSFFFIFKVEEKIIMIIDIFNLDV